MLNIILISLLLNTLCHADAYDLALSKAQEAAYIQSGAASFVNNIQDYTKKQTVSRLSEYNLQKEVGASLFLYSIIRNKQLTLHLQRKELMFTPSTFRIKIDI